MKSKKNAPFALYKGDAANAAFLSIDVVDKDTLGAKRYKYLFIRCGVALWAA